MPEHIAQVTEALRGMLDSPWLWVAVLLLAGFGGLVPFTPSQTSVVTVGMLIGPDPALLGLLALVAASGVLAGDCLGYSIGRWAGPGLTARFLRGERGRAAFARAQLLVERHAIALVVAGRYLPGGRVSSTLATGSVGFPLRRFLLLDAVGASVWALYVTGLGALGGASFSRDPLKGLLLATTLGLTISAFAAWLRRRAAVRAAAAATAGDV